MPGQSGMKASNLGFWITAAVLAWLGWIFLDMSGTAEAGSSTGKPGNASEFVSLVKSSPVPVMAQFYADWCGPCRAVEPVVADLTEELDGRARVVRLNVDEQQGLAASYNVRGIPTFVVFRNGKEVARQSGAISKARMKELLEL